MDYRKTIPTAADLSQLLDDVARIRFERSNHINAVDSHERLQQAERHLADALLACRAHTPPDFAAERSVMIAAAIRKITGFPDLRNGELSLAAELRAALTQQPNTISGVLDTPPPGGLIYEAVPRTAEDHTEALGAPFAIMAGITPSPLPGVVTHDDMQLIESAEWQAWYFDPNRKGSTFGYQDTKEGHLDAFERFSKEAWLERAKVARQLAHKISFDKDAIRAAAFEEAAQICDSMGGEIDMRNVDEAKLCANSLAHAIRRAKESRSAAHQLTGSNHE